MSLKYILNGAPLIVIDINYMYWKKLIKKKLIKISYITNPSDLLLL